MDNFLGEIPDRGIDSQLKGNKCESLIKRANRNQKVIKEKNHV